MKEVETNSHDRMADDPLVSNIATFGEWNFSDHPELGYVFDNMIDRFDQRYVWEIFGGAIDTSLIPVPTL